jgi:hypothetical protein
MGQEHVGRRRETTPVWCRWFQHRSLPWLVESKPLPVSQREECVASEKRR